MDISALLLGKLPLMGKVKLKCFLAYITVSQATNAENAFSEARINYMNHTGTLQWPLSVGQKEYLHGNSVFEG